MEQPFASYQYEIYLGGLSGQTPSVPIALDELEARAREKLSPEAWGYVAGAAGSEDTLRANLDAFRRRRIVPRVLRDVGQRDLTVDLFGTTLQAPVLLAPIGVQSIIHPEAEVAVARAAADVGVPIVLSTAASRSIEDVAEASGDNLRWYQLYWPNDPELAASFIRRADAAGYGAVVVTLDTPLLAWRPRDLQHAFLPFLRGEGLANYFSDPVFRSGLDKPPEDDVGGAVMRWVSVFSDPTSTWDKLSSLREQTELPILLKGVMHPDDAVRARHAGMNGVIVSNHGGRQVDGSIAALDALEAVAVHAADDFHVLFDSGIRTGSDAIKALALGAKTVLLGRPYAWGLAAEGEEGVRQVLRAFLADLDLSMALSGIARLDDVDGTILAAQRDPRPAAVLDPGAAGSIPT